MGAGRMIRLLAFLVAAALLMSATASAEEEDDDAKCSAAPLFVPFPPQDLKEIYRKPIRFSVLGNPKQRIIAVWGQICLGDSQRFRAALAEVKPMELDLFSPGGVLEEGIEMGRITRAHNLTTRVPRNWTCASACNFIFMGGRVRYVDIGAHFNVHMFDDAAYLALEDSMALPPQTLLEFARRYPQHPFTAEDIDDELKQMNKEQLLKLQQLEEIKKKLKVQIATLEATQAVQQAGSDPQQEPQTRPLKQAPSAEQQPAPDRKDPVQLLKATLESIEKAQKKLSIELDLQDWMRETAMNEDVRKIQQMSAQTAASIARFLTEMSISLRFLTEFANIPNANARDLRPDELRSFNIVNSDQ
jgi:hypothetical protein